MGVLGFFRKLLGKGDEAAQAKAKTQSTGSKAASDGASAGDESAGLLRRLLSRYWRALAVVSAAYWIVLRDK